MTTTHVITVDRLNLTYGDFHAVTDLSFQVEDGELHALLGSNGAAETSPVLGSDGSPTKRRAVRLKMGIMLPGSGFSPDLTVQESARLIGMLSQRTDTAERVLSIVELKHKADTLVSRLSGGEKRRLDFATAVYGSPGLVFLDEPAPGLDIRFRDDLWDAVDKLREDGSTVVLTTHHLEEAQSRADRVGLIHRDTFHPQGTVSAFARTVPSVIQFSVPARMPAPPPQATRASDGTYVIESFGLERDLKALLMWAEDHSVPLWGLSAGPIRLDDAFRAIGTDHTAARPSVRRRRRGRPSAMPRGCQARSAARPH